MSSESESDIEQADVHEEEDEESKNGSPDDEQEEEAANGEANDKDVTWEDLVRNLKTNARPPNKSQ